MNPLLSPVKSAIVGVILAMVFAFAFSTGNGNPAEWTVWIHVIVGIMWIGLLYYFNFVQVPAVGAALADGDAGPGPAAINKYVAPRALFYFRWAALLTWLTGLSALAQVGGMGMTSIMDAFLLKGSMGVIGVGAWLGTIMLFNVWVLIWPNQQKILGLKEATADEIAKCKVTALYASRINTILSIPMLLSMTAHGHGLPF